MPKMMNKGCADPVLGGVTGVAVGTLVGIIVGAGGVDVGLRVGDGMAIVGAIVAVGEAVFVGVSEAEMVASPRTCSPLFKIINLLETVRS